MTLLEVECDACGTTCAQHSEAPTYCTSCGKPVVGPKRASEQRPDGEPYYIDSECDCGTALELYDDVYDSEGEVWYDEWVCPSCKDGVHLDVPADVFP